MQDDFVHLHVHSEYSALDGINRVETLPGHVKSLGQRACSITDHGNMSGAYRFYKSCKEQEVKPIIGIEAYYTVLDRQAKEKDEDGKNYYHVVLLAQNDTGLRNLFAMSTKAYTEGMYYKPRLDDQLLSEHSEGVLATSACLGSRSSQLLLQGRDKEAAALIQHHAEIFKNRFFIELQLHEDKEQQLVNQGLMKIAKEQGLPLILSNDCHYTHENQKLVHEQALCVSTNAKMSYPPWNPEARGQADGPTRFSFGNIDVHVASRDWMWERAQKQGIPYDAIVNTRHIAQSIDADSYFGIIRNRHPKFKGLPEGLPPWEALENLSKHLLTKKLGGMPSQEYRDRINHELQIIKKMGFYDYLLIVQQFVEGANKNGIWTGPGRGSAAGSLVAYALGITQVDPIKYGLVFERWLNYGRAATPMILDQELIRKIEATKSQGQHCHQH